jgi:hypothetical protein
MKLLILDGDRDPRSGRNKKYRGTYRAHPTHCDDLPDNHPVNELFFWFLQEGGELGVVHNVEKALMYTRLLNKMGDGRRFELVEIADDGATPERGSKFLGYDLSSGYNYSLLVSGLELQLAESTAHKPIQELLILLRKFYAPQLNLNGLFQTNRAAQECLRSMHALQTLSPNLFEGVDLETNFQPTGLYIVE